MTSYFFSLKERAREFTGKNAAEKSSMVQKLGEKRVRYAGGWRNVLPEKTVLRLSFGSWGMDGRRDH
jgi:hypothetical protein